MCVFSFKSRFCSLPSGNAVDICHQQLFGDFDVSSSQGPNEDFRHESQILQTSRIFVPRLSDRLEAGNAGFGK